MDRKTENTVIDFTFLNEQQKKFSYSVLIVLNNKFSREQFRLFRSKSDFIICVDDAITDIYNTYHSHSNSPSKSESPQTQPQPQSEDLIIDLILYNPDNVKPEIIDFYRKNNIKIMYKNENLYLDLEKCLYYSLEKISSNAGIDFDFNFNFKSAIFILGVNDGRIHHTFSILENVYQYICEHRDLRTEFYIIAEASISVFLKNGCNIVKRIGGNNERFEGYSLVPFQEAIEVNIEEYNNDKSNVEKIKRKTNLLKVIYRTKCVSDMVRIGVSNVNSGFILFCSTTNFL